MRKKIVFIICSLILVLSSCGNKTVLQKETDKFYENQKGFAGSLGNRMYETPDGYYFLVGNYLAFIDDRLEKATLVCSRAECLHNEESVTNKVKCDAFFDNPRALSYYNGKLYVLANNWAKKADNLSSVYEMALDGSSRREIYSGGEGMQSFCIHCGNMYIYEQKFTDSEGRIGNKPILTITKFPVDKVRKKEVIFETNLYENPEINNLNCYRDNCYFTIVDFLPDGIVENWKRINIKTGKAENCAKKQNGFWLGEDRAFSAECIKENKTDWTWENIYYQWDLEGKNKKQVTSEDFEAIDRGAVLKGADDKFVYFHDIDYGADKVPEDKQKLYVYSYAGELVDEIFNGGMETVLGFYPGNEHYLFLYKECAEDEEKKIQYFYIDKEKFGKGAKPELFFSGSYKEFKGEAVY